MPLPITQFAKKRTLLALAKTPKFAALFAAFFFAGNAFPQEQPLLIDHSNGWSLFYGERDIEGMPYCFVGIEKKDKTYLGIGTYITNPNPMIVVGNENWASIIHDNNYPITIQFEPLSFGAFEAPGVGFNSNGGAGIMFPLTPASLSGVRRAQGVTLSRTGGALVANFTLSGSDEALDMLFKCRRELMPNTSSSAAEKPSSLVRDPFAD